ncbi:MAG: hypothetical protein QF535_15420 [Anaerolineales bacterium]|nr:hypothetical protein [Anaerolineales bacterium]
MKTVNNKHEESLHEQNPRGFMATHSTNEDRGFNIYYDGMPGGQERTIEYAKNLLEDGYDIEWDNATRIKSKGETRHEKLNTPKEKIQGTTQQSRSTTGTMDKGETDRSPYANKPVKEGKVEVEG